MGARCTNQNLPRTTVIDALRRGGGGVLLFIVIMRIGACTTVTLFTKEIFSRIGTPVANGGR